MLLLWVAIDLIVPDEEDDEDKIEAADNLWHAVRIVAVADIVMSLDNVIAIAAVPPRASWTLIGIGLAISIPMIIAGAALITALFDRFPILVWAGAGAARLGRGRAASIVPRRTRRDDCASA